VLCFRTGWCDWTGFWGPRDGIRSSRALLELLLLVLVLSFANAKGVSRSRRGILGLLGIGLCEREAVDANARQNLGKPS